MKMTSAFRLLQEIFFSEGPFVDFTVGEIYEDCGGHPCLCTMLDGDDVEGISLIDGSTPRSCSVHHCAPRAMTLEEALERKRNWETWSALYS